MPYQKIGNFKMKLTPREKDKLLISMAAEVARKRLERGVKLNYPEAIAIITDAVVEGARDVGQNTPENLPLRAISLASQIPTGSVPGDFGGGRDFQNFTVAGLELFRAPQTLVNIEATKNKEKKGIKKI